MLQAINERKRALAKLNARKRKVGDTITFNGSIRPAYMCGLSAVIGAINRESLSVRCPDDAAYGRFRNSQRVRVPLSLIA